MTLGLLALILFASGLVFLAAELLLPTHGLLGLIGAGGIIAALVVCFVIDLWLGLGVFLATLVATPFAGSYAVRLWPRTPLGRRLVLQPIPPSSPAPTVAIGQSGVTTSELRPGGVCDFGPQRLEVFSEQGMIPAGAAVRVVAIQDNRPIVRAVL
jgi:membrane-bound ClpP family serine protease